MLVPTILTLFGCALSAALDSSLTEWKLLKTGEERIMFPLRENTVEVKAFLPDVYDTNPPYGELIRTDKSTTMMMLLYSGSWNNKVGRLVWNTIKYDRGYDVAIEECDVRYQAYKSFPAGRKKEQIWAWTFTPDDVTLTCDGELQYYQHFDEGEENPLKPGLSKTCRVLGDVLVDRIAFRHMEGYYIRGVPDKGKNETVQALKSTTDVSTNTSVSDPDEIVDKEYPTCNCWTRECQYCRNKECTVKQDLINSNKGIQVTSKLKRRKLNSIVLYDDAAKEIGKFRWSLRGIWLTGCIQCLTPAQLRRARATEGPTTWSFSIKNGVVRIKINEKCLYEQPLIGECKERYNKASRFAFYDMTCENSFTYREKEMAAEERITPECADTCSQK
jgi:hypothetical protein